ncbi:MAG: site-specific DNA-methyltransferase [Chloroflexi bacterium]|nr:site-specific DNA-methyltransferase [Chloroflexota bacterium]
MDRHLFYAGDNLEGLELLKRRGLRADLVYIDPPFATGNDFLIGERRANTISGSGAIAYSDRRKGREYLDVLKHQLRAVKEVMSAAGSIYVHIGMAVEHRVRLLLDEVFGAHNFRNSITRIKCNPKNFHRNSYGNIKDTILFYSLSPKTLTWHPQREALSEGDIERLYPLVDELGRRYTTTPLHAPGVTRNGKTGQAWRGMNPPEGRHWRYAPDKLDDLDAQGRIAWSSTGNPRLIKYAEFAKGKLPQDVWEYKDPQNPLYPTQKNADMLERIILTSSDPGDTVLDCFAGSGETLLQAHRLGRRFVGMDNSAAAQAVIRARIQAINTEWITQDDNTRLRVCRAAGQSRKLARSKTGSH